MDYDGRMRITDPNPIKTAAEIRRKARAGSASSTSFADMLDALESGGDAPSALSDITATADISTMLALQEVSDEDIKRKKLISQGKNLLDELDKLRQQLLIGQVPMATLQTLASRLAQQRESVSDPGLLALIDDIELRAAVELAKLEVAARHTREG